jgi:hypothetical protein
MDEDKKTNMPCGQCEFCGSERCCNCGNCCKCQTCQCSKCHPKEEDNEPKVEEPTNYT